MKFNIFRFAAVAAVALAMTACEEDDKYTSRGDLFQPRFAADPAVKIQNCNDISIIWYQVNAAVGYTVQLFEDSYYQRLFMELDTTDPFVTIEDIPYSTTFYVRVRSNAANPTNNSQWATTSFSTETRPEYAQILMGVSKSEIGDNDAMIRWRVDPDNPVDSFSVVPAMSSDIPPVARYVTNEERQAGEIHVTGLTPSTLYTVNIYDTSKPRKYDKPYNAVSFRTTGPAPATVEVEATDDLSALLIAANDDPETAEGTVYDLLAGTTYTISPFAIKKGFVIHGPETGDRPVIVLNGTWSIAANANISTFSFENVELRNQADNQYFFNCGNPYELEEAAFTNCVFRQIRRGFWRHQGANTKHISSIEIDNCWFDQCGWQSGTYGTFAFGSGEKGVIGTYDNIQNITIRNTTFSRGGYKVDTKFGWGNLINHSQSSNPLNLTIENVTFYDFCVNNRLIDISNTERSSVTVRNTVIASDMGELLSLGSATSTNFSNNYATTDYRLGGARIRATSVPSPAADLFMDPDNGNLMIKDHSSIIYLTEAGDPRWLD